MILNNKSLYNTVVLISYLSFLKSILKDSATNLKFKIRQISITIVISVLTVKIICDFKVQLMHILLLPCCATIQLICFASFTDMKKRGEMQIAMIKIKQ